MSRRRDEERQKQKILNFSQSYGMMSKEEFKKLNLSAQQALSDKRQIKNRMTSRESSLAIGEAFHKAVDAQLNFQNTVKTTSVLTKEFSERLNRCSKMSFESQFILRLQKWNGQYGIYYSINAISDLKFKKVQHWHRKDLKRKAFQARNSK